MKTDQQLKGDVVAELAWDPAIKSNTVGVAVKDGIVTVTGHIETYAEKRAVEKALRRVAGVKAIAVELDVKLSPNHKRSDTDIAVSIENALKWNSLVPADKVRVTVDNGWVTLSGEVDWDYQRSSVVKAVRPLMGVVGVSNEMTLKTRAASSDVTRLIETALKRQAESEAKAITVDASGSTVTLRGKVHSWPERDAAGAAAWSAPGVRAVVNELSVG